MLHYNYESQKLTGVFLVYPIPFRRRHLLKYRCLNYLHFPVMVEDISGMDTRTSSEWRRKFENNLLFLKDVNFLKPQILFVDDSFCCVSFSSTSFAEFKCSNRFCFSSRQAISRSPSFAFGISLECRRHTTASMEPAQITLAIMSTLNTTRVIQQYIQHQNLPKRNRLENIGNFIKAIQVYGMKPHDIFEANDLYENGNMTQVQTSLVALAGLAKTKGFHTTIDIGVKYAEKQARSFDAGKLKAGQSVIGLQMGTNKCASQAGMTAYGTRRHLYDPKMQTDKPFDQTTISLQMGTNKGASQAGMLAPGTRRDIYDQKLTLQPVDNSTISLQMGTNKVASQKGMSVYGLGRQVYDPKYCAAPTEPVIHNGSQGTGTNGSEISDSDYQAEYPDDYHGEYQDDYQRDYHGQYSDQGIDY
ncbi:Calponin-3 [Chelonia mydas]|uniref:Calponin-3 n=1 Tax=Chelonia mydas TaxID=8469 RepID=M7AZ38_CHEMY|nr:Calponin-3 [Chelonia mydas]